jgi:hypothetical protein
MKSENRSGAGPLHGVDQKAGVAGHRGAATLVGQPEAAQGRWADRRRSRHQLLLPPHPTSLGPGPPDLQVLGAIQRHRVAQHTVSKAEIMAHAKNIFGRRICNRECPKVLGVYNPSDPVSHRR